MISETKRYDLNNFTPLVWTVLLSFVILFSACSSPQAKKRKAGEELQAKMMEIDKQFSRGLISQDEKEKLEIEAIESHRLRWNKIGDGPDYAPINEYQMRGGGAAQPYRQY